MLELHRKAMKLASQGFVHLKDNDESSKALFEEAFQLESRVAMSLVQEKDNEPMRSILFRSAASLAMLCGNSQQTISLAKEGLRGNPTSEVFRQLLDLLMNEQQQEFCYTGKPNLRLLAPAGSGKTTALLWRCLDQVVNSEKPLKFLVFTFTRVARDELRDRVNNDETLGRLKDRIRIETLNQWGNNYLRNYKNGIDTKTSKQDYYFLVRNNLRPEWEGKPIVKKIEEIYNQGKIVEIFSELKTLGFNHVFNGRTFFSEFTKHYKWLQENDLGLYFTEKVVSQLEELGLVVSNKKTELEKIEIFANFWKTCSEVLWKQAIITLEDQKYWALRILEEQYSGDKVFPSSNRYSHILVDEFQDINPLDLALIKKLKEVNRSSLTIVGDDDQAIYEWRGSSPKFIVTPENFFFEDFQTVILETNYRSPKNIVQLSQNLIEFNQNRVPKDISAFSSQDALVEVRKYNTHIDSLNYILSIAERIQNSKNETLAVISRKKGQLIPLQILLTSENLEYYAKEDLNILLSHAFNELKRILVISIEKNSRRDPAEITDQLIFLCDCVKKFPLNRADKKALKLFMLNAKPKTLGDAIASLYKFPGKLKSISSDSFAIAISRVISKNTVSQTIEAIEEWFEGLQKHYAKSDDDIFYKEPPFLYLSDYAKKYDDDFWGFIDHVSDAVAKMSEMVGDDTIDPDLKNQIHLMTALRAKGKEFDHVVILDVNDGLWPIKLAETEAQLEQERRLFYVAITRTKKQLSLITVDRIHDKRVLISPYLKEMGL